VIGFDACLMQAVDAVDDFRSIIKYYLASEATEPGHGTYLSCFFLSERLPFFKPPLIILFKKISVCFKQVGRTSIWIRRTVPWPWRGILKKILLKKVKYWVFWANGWILI